MRTYETKAYIYSLNKGKINSTEMDTVTVLEELENNKYKVNYKGVICTAIINGFNGLMYVDDIYGILED